jgi:FK506-binding protein 1
MSSPSWTISRYHTIARYTPDTMGVKKVVLKRGNGCDVPKKHDEVSMEYTGEQIPWPTKSTACVDGSAGWLYDESAPDMKGKQSVAS